MLKISDIKGLKFSECKEELKEKNLYLVKGLNYGDINEGIHYAIAYWDKEKKYLKNLYIRRKRNKIRIYNRSFIRSSRKGIYIYGKFKT